MSKSSEKSKLRVWSAGELVTLRVFKCKKLFCRHLAVSIEGLIITGCPHHKVKVVEELHLPYWKGMSALSEKVRVVEVPKKDQKP
jgi:hypothetical protein